MPSEVPKGLVPTTIRKAKASGAAVPVITVRSAHQPQLCNHRNKRNVQPSQMNCISVNCISTAKSGIAVGITAGIAVATPTHVSDNCISTATREAVAATKIIVNIWMKTATSKTRVSTATNQQPAKLDHEFAPVLFRKVLISRSRSGLICHMVTPLVIIP